jgi:hypothetical protein
MREIVERDMQPCAGAIVEVEMFALDVQEAERIIGEKRGLKRQNPVLERNRTLRLRKQAAGRNHRDRRTFGFFKTDRMRLRRSGEGPAKPRMQAAGIGKGGVARVGHNQRVLQTTVAELKNDLKAKGERIKRARFGVVRQDEPDEIVTPLGDFEFLSPGEAMQRERIALAIYANFAIAGPADNRKQNRSGSIPDRFIQLPDQFDAARPPLMKFGARTGLSRRRTLHSWPPMARPAG